MTTPTRERSVPLDPRLRARLREVRRDEGRRRLRRVQVGLGAVALGAGGWGLALSPVLDVDRVQVRGALRSGDAAVEETSGIERGEAMVTLDLARAASAVEALPWVETATVDRRWPGTVAVTVTERRPVAVMATGDGRWVAVDGDGRQLVVVDEATFPELARIVGVAPDARPGSDVGGQADGALQLVDLLATALPGKAPEVTVDDGELAAALPGDDGGAVMVRFGGAERLADKAGALAALADGGVLRRASPSLVVDVRVPDAPVLTTAQG